MQNPLSSKCVHLIAKWLAVAVGIPLLLLAGCPQPETRYTFHNGLEPRQVTRDEQLQREFARDMHDFQRDLEARAYQETAQRR